MQRKPDLSETRSAMTGVDTLTGGSHLGRSALCGDG